MTVVRVLIIHYSLLMEKLTLPLLFPLPPPLPKKKKKGKKKREKEGINVERVETNRPKVMMSK